MRAEVVDHRRHLLVIEQCAERRHALRAVHHDEHRVSSLSKLWIVGQRRIGAGPDRSLRDCHVAALAHGAIDHLSIALHEAS